MSIPAFRSSRSKRSTARNALSLCVVASSLALAAACGSTASTAPTVVVDDTPRNDAGTFAACGNAVQDQGETCDDGNTLAGDGCSASCQAEPLYVCSGAGPASCQYKPEAWVQQAYAKASNTEKNDAFGGAVALSADGTTLAVGAALESSKATGVGGDQNDNSETQAGAVYVFVRVGTKWTQQAYIKSAESLAYNSFGTSLSLSADGSTLAVGADAEDTPATGGGGTAAGAAYVFGRVGATWSQQARLRASNTGADDNFGAATALSPDGQTLAVGAPQEDSASKGIGASQTDNMAADAGAVYVFGRAGVAWSQQAYVKASNTGAGDKFGASVSLSSEGNLMAVGAHGEASSAVGVGGNQADNGAAKSGAVYTFVRANAAWSQQAYLKASNTGPGDRFGGALALASDGKTLAVGAAEEDSVLSGIDRDQTDDTARDAGAVYIFSLASSSWVQQAYVKASNTAAANRFGIALSLSGDGAVLLVGAGGESSSGTGVGGSEVQGGAPGAGAVYEFHRAAAKWKQQTYVKASNTEASDGFGTAVSISGDARILASGAPGEASSAKGIEGDRANNTQPNSGAVYLFNR